MSLWVANAGCVTTPEIDADKLFLRVKMSFSLGYARRRSQEGPTCSTFSSELDENTATEQTSCRAIGHGWVTEGMV